MIATIFLLFTFGIIGYAAETLQDTLRTSSIPTQQFSAPELAGNVTSYAISTGNLFLLAYYIDNGSGLLYPPLHVIRYDRTTGDLRRTRSQWIAFDPPPEECPRTILPRP